MYGARIPRLFEVYNTIELCLDERVDDAQNPQDSSGRSDAQNPRDSSGRSDAQAPRPRSRRRTRKCLLASTNELRGFS